MRIELPFPSSKLHAHAKGHWRSKAEATKAARQIAKLASIDATKLSGPVEILYEFFVPDLRQRDEANLIQSCKPYIDGIVDAGVCEGDDWQRMSITGVSTELDRENPRVVLHFTERP